MPCEVNGPNVCLNDGKCGLHWNYCRFPKSASNGVPTEVWFVEGRQKNKTLREKILPVLRRETRTLSSKDVSKKDEHEVDSEQDQSKET